MVYGRKSTKFSICLYLNSCENTFYKQKADRNKGKDIQHLVRTVGYAPITPTWH